MADLSYKVNVDTTQAQNALQKLDNQTNSLSKSFGALKTAIGALAVGAFIRNAFEAANAISDLAKATNVSTQAIIGLNQAFIANGSDAESAQQAIGKLVQNIGDAANGSAQLQSAFREVGVSLQDLATLSEEDILRKTIKGLGDLNDTAKRSSLGIDLLGRAAKGLDFKGLASDVDSFIDGAAGSASATESAGKASQNFKNAIAALQTELLKALEPISEFFVGVTKNTQAIADFISTALKIVVVIASFTLIGKVFRGIVLILASIPRAITAIVVGFKSLGTTFSRILQQFTRFRKAGEITSKTLKGLETRFGFLKEGIDLVKSGIGFLGGLITTAFALAAPQKFAEALEWVGVKIGLVKSESEKLLIEMNKASAKAHKDAREAKERAEKEAENLRKVQDALANKRKAIDDIGRAYVDANKRTIESYENELRYLQLTERQAEIQQAIDNIEQQRQDTVKRLNDELQKLSDQEKEIGETIRKNIDIVNSNAEAEKKRAATAIENLQKERELIDARNQEIEFGNTLFQNKLALEAMRAEIAMLAMTQEEREEYQKLLKIEQDLKRALMEIDIEAERVGKNATDSQIKDWERRRQAAIDYANKVKEINADEKVARDDQQTQIEVWSKETQKSLEDSLKPANRIKGFWEGLSNQIDEFTRTGKFRIKDFLLSIVQQFLAAQLKLAALKIFQSIFGGAFGGIPLPGRANGGPVKGGQPYMVGERGAELFIPNQSGKIIPNNKLGNDNKQVNAPITNNYITNNINAVDAKSVAQLFAENRKTLLGAVATAQREMPYMA